jgi:hypothetical protein
LEKNSRSQVLVRVPPVGWTRGRTTSAQDTLVQAVQLGSVLRRLVELLLADFDVAVLALQVRLDRLVLSVEVAHVRHEVLDDEHVRQRVNLGLLVCVIIDFAIKKKNHFYNQIFSKKLAQL